VDCSLCLPWNAKKYPGAELNIAVLASSQIPVCVASQFAMNRLLKFVVPWLDSDV